MATRDELDVVITLPTKAYEYISRMRRLGFGNTDNEAAQYLLLRAIDDGIRAGLLEPEQTDD